MKLTKTELNFLPPVILPPPFSRDFLILCGVVVTFFFAVVLGLNQHLSLSKMEKKAKQLSNMNMIQANQVKQLEREFSSSQEATKAMDTITAATKSDTVWANYYKEISLIIPRSVWIEKLKIKNVDGKNEILIRGRSNSQENVSIFFSNLSKSKNFKTILMSYSEISQEYKPQLVKFEFATGGFFKFGGEK